MTTGDLPAPDLNASGDFARLPLTEQEATLSRALDRAADPRGLLRTCAALRDPAPLVFLVRALLSREWLADADARAFFAAFLLGLPEVTVHRVVRAATEALPVVPDDLAATIALALEDPPLEALAAVCILDRALRQHAPAERAAHQQRVVAAARAQVLAGRADDLPLGALAQVPGRAVVSILAECEPTARERFDRRREALARAAIAVLSAAPKAVSQANAEELLARRVYTDPGHFLVELLQNAEDSGARAFHVRFGARRLVVWHDGTPFDTRDLVGVTSIGQTTKSKQQIGFFGVGFKSVYEVTERPQVFSDVYRFEIADVSVPRELAGRPPDLPQDGTLLVLPVRPGLAPGAPRDLFLRACALDPCVLLTLPSMAELRFDLEADAGGPSAHLLREESHGPGVATLRQTPDGWARSYLLEEQQVVWTDGARPPGRPDRSRLLVGVHTDAHGTPHPLPPGAATVYSYLPTAEATGLRFFVQAHFEVPVDRERITAESPWNRWLLSHVPALLGRLAQRLATDPARSTEARRAAAHGLLEVLPLARELASPTLSPLATELPRAFAGTPSLPGADGGVHAPEDVAVAARDLVLALEGGPLLPRGRPLYLLDPALDERARDVARALGAGELRPLDLLEAIESASITPGELPAWLPALRAPTLVRLARLHGVLAQTLETGDHRDGTLDVLVERLRALPLVPDEALVLSAAAADDAPASASLEVRELLRGSRRFLPVELDEAANGATADPRAVSLLRHLQLTRARLDAVIDVLEGALVDVPVPLAGPEACPALGTPERLERLLALLVDQATPALLERAARLPLFRARDARLWPAARGDDDLGGVVAVAPRRDGEPDVPRAEALATLIARARPVAMLGDRDGSQARLLERLRAPRASVELLVGDLERDPTAYGRDLESLDALHSVLEAWRDEVPQRLRKLLARLSIWPDADGVPGVLRSRDGESVRAPLADDVAALFPDARWLHPRVRARRHATAMGADTVGVDEVVAAFARRARPPLKLDATPECVAAALQVLLAHADGLAESGREHLGKLPAFLSDRGAVTTLDGLARIREGASAGLRDAWGDARAFLDPTSASATLVARLGLETHVALVDVEDLVRDLEGAAEHLRDRAPGPDLPFVPTRERALALLDALAAEAPRMGAAVGRATLALPVFLDHAGHLGHLNLSPLRAQSAPRLEPGALLVCSDEVAPHARALGARTLDAALVPRVAPLLAEAGVAPLDVVGLVRFLRAAPEATWSGLDHDALQALLVARLADLEPHHPLQPRAGLPPACPVLCNLPLWRTLDGTVVRALDLVEPGPLLPLCDEGTAERAALDRARLVPDAHARLLALAPRIVATPPAPWLIRWIAEHASHGEPLAAQPALVSTIPGVAATLEVLCAPDAQERAPSLLPEGAPLVDARGLLRLRPLRRAARAQLDLLAGLPAEVFVVHADLLLAAGERARPLLDALPELSASSALKALALWPDTAPARAAGEHPTLGEATRRARVYAWLLADEGSVLADAEVRATVAASRLVLGRDETLLSPRELVLDVDLSELGGPGAPHAEVPRPLLDLLARHLDAGRPSLVDLSRRHLGPTYRAAVAANRGEDAARVLRHVARRLHEPGAPAADDVVAALGDVRVEDEAGAFRAASDLLLPALDVASAVRAVWGEDGYAAPSSARFAPQVLPLLFALGVRTRPSPERVVAAVVAPPRTTRDALLGLAALVAALWRGGEGEALLPALRANAWVPDGTGCPRRPGDVWTWSKGLEALVGPAPERFVDPAVPGVLGAATEVIGFRGLDEVSDDDVLGHIDACVAAGQAAPPATLAWLEQGLARGDLDAQLVRARLGTLRCLATEDGDVRPPAEVVGATIDLGLLGKRRGSWRRGLALYPRLGALLQIPPSVGPEVVLAVLREVSADAGRLGPRALLAGEPALPRMLLSCLALLGDTGTPLDPALIVVPCVVRGGAEDGVTGLAAASRRDLVLSDAPTLEALFAADAAASGAFLVVAAPGGRLDPERLAEAERALERAGVRRLRESAVVTLDPGAGRDVTAERTPAVQRVRATLRALLAALPRVRARRRAGLAETGWRFEERLALLARAGALRVVDGLAVRWTVDGVGHARERAAAAWDASAGALLVDARAAEAPQEHAPGLAAGLMPCVYQGPGEEQVTDLLGLLLPLGDRERMLAYLDARHFPAGRQRQTPGERLLERVGEALDHGLDARLASRFPALAGRDLGRWRSPAIAKALLELPGAAAEGEGAEGAADLPKRAARLLLEAVGLSAPEEALARALETLLGATTLVALASDDAAPEPLPTPTLAPVAPPPPPPPAKEIVDETSTSTSTSTTTEISRRATSTSVSASASASASARGVDLERLPVVEPPRAAPAPPPPPHGFWTRLGLSLGLMDEVQPEVPPAWTGDNPFAVTSGVPSQLWATSARRQALEQTVPVASFTFSPGDLPPPWTYAPSALGATFDPATQAWLEDGAPTASAYAPLRATGQTVVLTGTLRPGESHLPVPLHARLRGQLELVAGGEQARLLRVAADSRGAVRVRVAGDKPLHVRYEVELLEPPLLGVDPRATVQVSDALRAPTVAREALPHFVRDWLTATARGDAPPWARALGVQELVRRRYVYDAGFDRRGEVVAARRRLRRGVGNHHLELLHAGADADALGRGICYELNVLVAELLRHLGIPSLVATCWTFQGGHVARPDHLIALALLPSAAGPFLLPLDATLASGDPAAEPRASLERPRVVVVAASELRDVRCPLCKEPVAPADGLPLLRCGGCRTVMHEPCFAELGGCPSLGCKDRRAPRLAVAPPRLRPAIPPPPGPWAPPVAAPGPAPTGAAIQATLLDAVALEELRARAQRDLLRRAVQLVAHARGLTPPADARATEAAAVTVARLSGELERLLPDRALSSAVLALVRGDLERVPAVAPDVQALVRLGVARVESVPAFRVRPVD